MVIKIEFIQDKSRHCITLKQKADVMEKVYPSFSPYINCFCCFPCPVFLTLMAKCSTLIETQMPPLVISEILPLFTYLPIFPLVSPFVPVYMFPITQGPNPIPLYRT